MSLSDINWGAFVAGAAAAVVVVAFAQPIGLSVVASFVQANAAHIGYVYGGAALVGGIAAEFATDLIGRTGQAVTTIARG